MKNLVLAALTAAISMGAVAPASAEIFALWKQSTTSTSCTYQGEAYYTDQVVNRTIAKKDGKCPVYLKYNTQTKSLLKY